MGVRRCGWLRLPETYSKEEKRTRKKRTASVLVLMPRCQRISHWTQVTVPAFPLVFGYPVPLAPSSPQVLFFVFFYFFSLFPFQLPKLRYPQLLCFPLFSVYHESLSIGIITHGPHSKRPWIIYSENYMHICPSATRGSPAMLSSRWGSQLPCAEADPPHCRDHAWLAKRTAAKRDLGESAPAYTPLSGTPPTTGHSHPASSVSAVSSAPGSSRACNCYAWGLSPV